MTQIEKFLKEKMYLQNVSSCTLDWYTHALKKLPSEQPTQEQLNNLVISLRESGLKETAVNACARALNCYLKWSGSSCHIRHLQEPSFIPPTFSITQVNLILKFKPTSFYERRTQLCLLILFDTGARISEILGLRVCEVDFDNLLLTLSGKGRKQRIIPFSNELRRRLYYYTRTLQPQDFVLSTQDGRRLNRNVVLREGTSELNSKIQTWLRCSSHCENLRKLNN